MHVRSAVVDGRRMDFDDIERILELVRQHELVEFELERVVHAPVEQVFARLADIQGYNEWMPAKGSILKRTQLTSPGEPGLGTTFVDETKYGPTPGEIVEFEPPRTVVFHWWEKTKRGRLTVEGWLRLDALVAAL